MVGPPQSATLNPVSGQPDNRELGVAIVEDRQEPVFDTRCAGRTLIEQLTTIEPDLVATLHDAWCAFEQGPGEDRNGSSPGARVGHHGRWSDERPLPLPRRPLSRRCGSKSVRVHAKHDRY